MDQFVQADEVRARMGLDPLVTENETVIVSAIQAAQFTVQDYLGTELQLTSSIITDTFYLDGTLHNDYIPEGTFRLHCTRGFLLNDANFTIQYSTMLLGAVWTDMLVTDFIVERQSGRIKVSETHEDKYVKVTYKAGFSTDGGPEIPAWLKEGIIAYTPSQINVGGGQAQNPGGLGTAADSAKHALTAMARYVRSRAFVWYPVTSSEA